MSNFVNPLPPILSIILKKKKTTFFLVWTEKSILNLLQYIVSVSHFVSMKHVGSYLPDQGSNLHPLHWKVKS